MPGDSEHASDPERSGHSLANLWEILAACLDAAGARSVAEVGAFAGDLTRRLLEWAKPSGARIVAIDPLAHPGLIQLADEQPELELVAEASTDALSHIPVPDAVIIDGDHNYFTVSEELRVIAERAPTGALPLLLFHDVCWPHGRRDAYWNPERIPEEHRQPLAYRPVLFPGVPGRSPGGLSMHTSAANEGGAKNGVLTALEDFVAGRQGLRAAVIPAFFGLGVVWHSEAPWAGAISSLLAPWDSHPVLERLEANRVFHLATSSARAMEVERVKAELADREAELARLRARLPRD
ncbi:MAG TPA: class I SAM-dependent methyltransferase [Solirubrobacterales bacterium]|nr:class I SAM-dependent methyltransferase [Solirubrobacterales bacterium]